MAWQARTIMMSALLATFCGGAAASDPDADMERARALLKEGKAADAYRLLEPEEFEYAGDVEFDTMLGIAALDGGKPDKATLAFERVLALEPDAAGVRLDMARAYFALGDYPRAREELTLAAAQNPPPAARTVIDHYLNAIAEREQKKRTAVTGYLESSLGIDTNITSVVGDFTNAVLATYNLAGFQPTGNAIRRESAIVGVGGGLEVLHQASEALTLFANADLRHRGVIDASSYSSDQIDLRAGASYAVGANAWRAGLSLQDYHQRTDVPTANRRSVGVNAEWRRMLGAADQFSVLAAATRQRFPDIAVNDVDTLAAGVGLLHLFDTPRKPLLYASLLGGEDDARNRLANGADNSKRFVSARLYGQLSAGDATDVFASVGLTHREDRSAFARSTMTQYGNDRMLDLTLGWNWRPASRWTVRPQIMHAQNRSNVALSEYQRTEASVAVRYDWN
jgi:outer membrane protein